MAKMNIETYEVKKKNLIADLVNAVNEAPGEAIENEKETHEELEDIPVKVEKAFKNNDPYLLLLIILV